jgi:hypothetical protein
MRPPTRPFLAVALAQPFRAAGGDTLEASR